MEWFSAAIIDYSIISSRKQTIPSKTSDKTCGVVFSSHYRLCTGMMESPCSCSTVLLVCTKYQQIYLISIWCQQNHFSLQNMKGCKEFWPLLENKDGLHFQHLVACIPESINMFYIIFFCILYLFFCCWKNKSLLHLQHLLERFPESINATRADALRIDNWHEGKMWNAWNKSQKL